MTTDNVIQAEALLPCPFCGDHDEYNPSYSTVSKYAEPGDVEAGTVVNLAAGLIPAGGGVECDKCGGFGPTRDTEAEAIAAWNTRAFAKEATPSTGVERKTVPFTPELIAAASAETDRLCRELDITNADHIALWLEANALSPPLTHQLAWVACRIAEAHEAALSIESATPSASVERETLEWFSGHLRLSLDHHSPLYGDDDDQSVEWRVTRETGPINDREWDVVGRGPTTLAAILNARKSLPVPSAPQGDE